MGQEFGRRAFLAATGAAGAGAVFALDEAGAVRSNGPGRDGVSRRRPKRGGRLVIGTDAEEAGFSPSTGRFDTSGTLIARCVYDPMMAVGADGRIVPYLAESLTPNSDYTKWTVTLRPGVKFHDGTPCDGKALITNFNAAFSSPIAVALRPLVKGAEQTGELSMTIEMQHPWVTFPATYAAQQVAFVASPSMAKLPNSGGAHPIGTGPFVFKEWAVDSHITLTANPHYWRPGLPYLDEVTFRPIPDDDARSQALASGAVDMIITTSPQTIARLSGDRRFSFVDNRGRMVGSPNLGCLMLNCSKPPFDDPLARRILATGISAEAYSKVINQGIIPPARGLFQPGSPYYSTTSYPTYDKKKARSLAAEYRSKHGKALEFTSLGTATPQSIRQGEYMQQVLKDVGVTLHTQHISQNEVISAALSGTYQAMGWLSFGGISPDLDYVWFSPTTIDPHGISLNMAHNDDPQIERAMVAGMGARSRRDQIAAFRKVNERLAVDLPYIWINRSVWAIASSTHAQNWNNPRSPEGHRLLGNDQGLFWLTQAWRS